MDSPLLSITRPNFSMTFPLKLSVLKIPSSGSLLSLLTCFPRILTDSQI